MPTRTRPSILLRNQQRLQFTLLALLGCTTLISLFFGLWRWTSRSERARQSIQSLGGEVVWVEAQGMIEAATLPPDDRYWRVIIGRSWQGGDSGLAQLSKIRNLTSLTITGGSGTTSAALEHCRYLNDLRFLELRHIEWTPLSLSSLRDLDNLTELRLGGTNISDAALADLHDLPRLRTLHLGGTQVTNAGLSMLNPRVRELDLFDTAIDDSGLVHLQRLEDLEVLRLSRTKVSDSGMPLLQHNKRLCALDLARTKVTDASALTLARFPSLKILDLRGTSITTTGENLLRGATNGIRVVR